MPASSLRFDYDIVCVSFSSKYDEKDIDLQTSGVRFETT